jgi:threonine dehydrogenase-like Zn-dependent dehydrogenase
VQAIVVSPGVPGSMRLSEIAEPIVAPDEVIVRTLEVGVCGTDRSIGAGHFGAAPADRGELIIGHEVLGALEQPAAGLDAGTLVAATVRRPCGHCFNCDAGEMDSCTTGDFLERGIVGLDGFAAELFAEATENLVPIPASLGRLGVLAEPASIAERGLRHAVAVGQRQGWKPLRAIVLGVGALGMLSVLALRLRGIETWALSRGPGSSPRADLVEAAGASYVSTGDVSLAALGAEIGGADLILEAAGSPELMVEAIGALAPNGVLCLRGIDAANRPLEVDSAIFGAEIVLKNKAIIGSTNAGRGDWTQGVADLEAIHERWPGVLETIVGTRVDPGDFAAALSAESVKATIAFA